MGLLEFCLCLATLLDIDDQYDDDAAQQQNAAEQAPEQCFIDRIKRRRLIDDLAAGGKTCFVQVEARQ